MKGLGREPKGELSLSISIVVVAVSKFQRAPIHFQVFLPASPAQGLLGRGLNCSVW